MKIKNLLIGCLAAGMLLSSCGVTDSELPSLEVWGMQIVSMLDEAAANEEFVSNYSAGEDIKNAVQTLSQGDHSDPKAIYQVNISEEFLLAYSGADAIPELSDDLRDFLTSRILSSIITSTNARGGVEILAATSVCTVGKTFLCSDEITEDIIYLYTYENASPVAVVFTVGECDTVSATGTFLYAEALNTDSPESIEEFFSEIDIAAEVVPLD